MALRRSSTGLAHAWRSAGVVATAVALLAMAGCAGGPFGSGTSGPSAPSKPSQPSPQPPQVVAATDWERFQATGAALRRDIQTRADAMKSGPVGNRAVELASLRISANAQDLIDAGSLDGALVALQRAVSLDGSNGYAYLFLAYVHQVQGQSELAGELAANAGRFLPRQADVRAELAGLRLAISQAAATTAGP